MSKEHVKNIDTTHWLSWNLTSNFTDLTFGALRSTQLRTLHSFSHVDTCGLPTRVTCCVPWKPGSMSNLPGTSLATFDLIAADCVNEQIFVSALVCPDSLTAVACPLFHNLLFNPGLEHAGGYTHPQTVVGKATCKPSFSHQTSNCFSQGIYPYRFVDIPTHCWPTSLHHWVFIQCITLGTWGQEHDILVVQVNNVSTLLFVSVSPDNFWLKFVQQQPSLVALWLWIFTILKVLLTWRSLQHSYLWVERRTT